MSKQRATIVLVVLPGIVGALASPATGQSRKLNGSLAPLPAADGGARIFESFLSSDGEWVVYRADHELSAAPRLYSVPTDGSAPARPISAGDVKDLKIGPDGAWVAFRDSSLALYLVATDGSQAPTLLGAGAGQYRFTPDGEELVFQSDGLRVVPVLGGTPTLLAPGGDALEISPDGIRAVYRVRTSVAYNDFEDELWSVPLDGSSAPIHLTPGFVGEMPDFRISPDGTRVVYRFEELVLTGGIFHVLQLYSVRLDASSSPVRISLREGAAVVDVLKFALSADSTLAVYTARSETSGVVGLYRAALEGGLPARLSGAPVSGVNVISFELTADDRLVVYREDPAVLQTQQLHVVPLRGNGVPAVIDQPGVVSFATTADSEWVVFSAQAPSDAHPQLYSARLQRPPRARVAPDRARTLNARRLNVTAFEDAELLAFGLGGPRGVVYAARQDSHAFELYRVDVEGDLPPLKLSAPFPEGGNLENHGFAAGIYVPALHVDPTGQWVVYRADQETDELIELFAVPLDGGQPPRRLNPSLPPGPSVGHVWAYYLDPDGQHVLFEADGGRKGVNELYRVPLAGGAPAWRLNQPLLPETLVLARKSGISPDGRWAVFQVEPKNEFLGRRNDLYSVDLWSSAAPLCLTGDLSGSGMAHGIQISADSTRLAFSAENDVFGATLDGSAPLVQISDQTQLWSTSTLRLTADGPRVVYPGREAPSSVRELFSAPLDGGEAPVKLDVRNVVETTSALEALQVDPGGWLAYMAADAGSPDRIELFGAPADGSSPPVRHSGSMVAGGDVSSFELAGDRIVYLADEEVDGRSELYSAPVSGAPRVRLSGSFDPGSPGVWAFLVTPQEDLVIYHAQQLGHVSPGIYRVAIDGSSAAQRLCRASLQDWRISPDGAYVVFTSWHGNPNINQLYSMPLDDSRPLARLNANMVPGGDVAYAQRPAFQISPDSTKVVYLADQTVNDRSELFAVDIDGITAPVVLNGPLVEGGDVEGYSFPAFQITLDGQEVVYLADQERDGILELFASPLP